MKYFLFNIYIYMFGKGLLQRLGRVAVHGAKAVYSTGMKIGQKILESPYTVPLAVAGLTASGYGATAIPAFLAAVGTAKALQEGVKQAGQLDPILQPQRQMITPQGTRTTQGATRNWGDQYSGGNRQLGRGNYRSRIPQMRPDGMN